MNLSRGTQCARGLIEAVDLEPVQLVCECVVDFSRRFQMREVRFMQIVPQLRVIACGLLPDQVMSLRDRHAQVNDQIFGRQRVDPVFELLEPGEKLGAPL